MFISIGDQNMKVNVRESHLGEMMQKGEKVVFDLKQLTQLEVYTTEKLSLFKYTILDIKFTNIIILNILLTKKVIKGKTKNQKICNSLIVLSPPVTNKNHTGTFYGNIW